MTIPVTSTSVATNGADETAGSMPRRFRAIGSIEPGERAPEHDTDEGQPDRDGDERPVRAVESGETSDQSVMRRKPTRPRMLAEHEAGEHLAPHHAPPVAEADLAQGQAADDERAACEPALPPVPMRAGTKKASDHRAASSPSKWPIAVRGQHLAHEQQQQPADALADHAPERGRRSRARPGRPARRRPSQDVLGALLDQDVDDVVHGHEAHHAAVLLQHGHRQQVVLGDLVRPPTSWSSQRARP